MTSISYPKNRNEIDIHIKKQKIKLIGNTKKMYTIRNVRNKYE